MSIKIKGWTIMYIQKLFVFITAILLIFLSCATTTKTIQLGIGEIYGYVLDDETNEPLMDVEIYIDQYNYLVRTDSRGLYSIKELDSEKYTLHFTKEGYKSVKISNISLGYGEHYKLNVWMIKNDGTDLSEKEKNLVSSNITDTTRSVREVFSITGTTNTTKSTKEATKHLQKKKGQRNQPLKP